MSDWNEGPTLFPVTQISLPFAVDETNINEDRQIEHAFYDYGVLKIKPELEPSRDTCGEDCWFRYTFTPVNSQVSWTIVTSRLTSTGAGSSHGLQLFDLKMGYQKLVSLRLKMP